MLTYGEAYYFKYEIGGMLKIKVCFRELSLVPLKQWQFLLC